MELKEKKIFNLDSEEKYEDCKILGGNPNGILNFNRSKHQWAYKLYKNMVQRFWTPETINISKDKPNYSLLTEEEKKLYELILAQLITNDSIQANQLVDRFNQYITSPVVNAALIRQAGDEILHSDSYAVMAEELVENTDKIYNMYLYDKELMLKNKAIEKMYEDIYSNIDTNNKITKESILTAVVCNLILEYLIFPCGFVLLLHFRNKLVGTTEMICEIMKDELGSHVPLFKQIYKTILNENPDIDTKTIIKNTEKVIKDLTASEIRWILYVTKNILGYSKRIVEELVYYRANHLLSFIGSEYRNFTELSGRQNPLNKLIEESIRGGSMSIKENFFENRVTEYSKGLIMDL